MDFQTAYEQWLEEERKRGSQERRRKLRDGLGFAERTFVQHVWWPFMGDFRHLHPEYEVADYSGGARFVDFAYLRGAIKLAIEIDGFRTHAQNIDRRQFAYQLHRQNLLIVDGWDILRFSFDDVEARPRRCQQTIQQYMGSRFAVDLRSPAYLDESPRVTVFAREIIRLARGLPRPLAPRDVCEHLGVARPTAYRHLKRLTAQGLLVPASGTKRIRTYRLAPTTQHFYI